MTLREALFAFAFYILITLVFSYKIFLGLIPLPTDLIVGAYYPWLNYKWENYIVGVPVQNPKLSDAVSLYYPFKELAVDFIKKGQLPLWNPYMFGGYPLLANVQAGLLFPTMIFYLIFSSHLAWTIQTLSQPILAGFFMYLLARHLKLGKIASLFSGIAFGFGGSTILWIQWNTQATTSLFLPILILFEDKYLNSKKIIWGVLFSVFLFLQILAGYLPIIPLTMCCLGLWFLFRSKNYFSDLRFIFFLILGFSLSAIFLIPVVELIQLSQRLFESIDQNASFFAPENLLNILAPDFFGNPATANFWGKGDNMDATIYTGVTTLVLSILGLKSFYKKSDVIFCLYLLILTLVISIFNPLSNFLYNLGIWGGSSVTMNRANFLINFALSILSGYGISQINLNPKSLFKSSIWIFSAALGIVLGLIISRYFLTNDIYILRYASGNANDLMLKVNIGLRNMILPLILSTLTLAISLVLYRYKQLKLAGVFFLIIILLLDLFRFGLKFNTFSDPKLSYPETPISQFLKQFPYDRMLAEKNIFPANMWLPFKIASIQGYDGLYPVNIAKILSVIDSKDIDAPPKPRWGLVGNFDSRILDATNTRFLLAVKLDEKGKPSSNGHVSVTIPPKYKEVFQDKGIAVLENSLSFPRVYATKKVIKASDRDTLKLISDETFPLKDISLTNDFEFNNPSEDNLDTNFSYNMLTNSHIQIKSKTNLDAYLVVLDSFYPGWRTLIDGKDTTIYKTNYNFRGILLPKGEHSIDFIYQPKSLQYGAALSSISTVILILLLVVSKYVKNAF